MAKLTSKDIKHVAKLAKLSLSSKEISLYRMQLTKVIEYINELDEVDTNDIKPTSQTTGLDNVTRDDVIKESLSKDDALSGSDSTYKDYFKVGLTLLKKEI